MIKISRNECHRFVALQLNDPIIQAEKGPAPCYVGVFQSQQLFIEAYISSYMYRIAASERF